MKRHTPALTAEAIAAAASKKTAKVLRKLMAAQAELRTARAALQEAYAAGVGPKIKAALEHSLAAEEKVLEATEDLEAVKQLLSDAEPEGVAADRRGPPRPRKKPAAGKSGVGARSLMPHLRKNVG